ncbi:MAG: hypothetical protein HDS04_09010 [Bacteroides sp.]|nr:hypothetical protein [Bacteroidales bacterium]MBD5326794.1 hypothetical protein [Bacteroides sp.]
MKTQIATTKEQSQRLLECMVNSNTADMYANNYDALWNAPFKDCCRKKEVGFSPAWSLSALLSLLPKCLMWQGLYYRLVMGPNENGWEIEYNDLSVLNNLHRVKADSPIEACVQMIEWLTKNGYTLNVK